MSGQQSNYSEGSKDMLVCQELIRQEAEHLDALEFHSGYDTQEIIIRQGIWAWGIGDTRVRQNQVAEELKQGAVLCPYAQGRLQAIEEFLSRHGSR